MTDSSVEMAQILATEMTNWWEEVNESTQWQDGIFFALCGAYALVSAIALVQLVRIQMRVPEYGWTTQKFALFCLDFTIKYFSSIPRLFAGYYWIFRGSSFSRLTHCSYCSGQRYITRQESKKEFFFYFLFNLPHKLLMCIYVADSYEQARSLPTDKLRITYISVNVAVYLAQVVIWVCIWVNDNSTVELVGKIFMSVVSFIAALGFLLYGGR
ncbi:unnamed protein product [Brassica rapa]|uniref:THH1/TOM1/TOM3 domain-containing protein n=1 Tax=Brassica campestris TaxID=3711 RepID=A0A8D9GNE6_BRACM|nr:unnamed protein product [Brassica rapa]